MNKILSIIFAIALLVLGGFVASYFWMNTSYNELHFIPMTIMFSLFGYIVIQMVKRFLSKEQNWWDWLYYIGLIGVLIVRFFLSESNVSQLGWIAKLSTLFLIIPVFFDLRKILQK